MFLGIKDMQLVRGCNLDKRDDAISNAGLMNKIELAARKFMV